MKHSAILSLSALIILMTSVQSCKKDSTCINGTGTIQTRVIASPTFQGVRASGSWDVFIEDGDAQEVKAIGHSNIIDRLQVDVDGGLLTLELEDDCYQDFELEIHITTPSLASAILNGSGDIDISPMEENASDLYLEILGSGDIDFQEFTGVTALEVRIEGSGSVKGAADLPDLIDLNVNIEGSGNYEGFDIICSNAVIDIAGSGNCSLHVLENLDVTIEGSGNVFYKGDPTITSDITGSGNLIDSN